jgi:hypothetical protein
MGKIQKQKADAARIYNLPADYVKRCRYTAFLQARSEGRKLICWYIGPDTGRLIGAYCWLNTEYPEAEIFAIKEDGSLAFDDYAKYETWDELQSTIRRAPELYCTDYMPYFMGVGNLPGWKSYGKVIPFIKVA